jgi:Domain of unknown function (DUF397)
MDAGLADGSCEGGGAGAASAYGAGTGLEQADSPWIFWQKSMRSMGNGNCVETMHLPDAYVAVRDSKNKGPVLFFPPTEWQRFVRGVKSREFDLSQHSSL